MNPKLLISILFISLLGCKKDKIVQEEKPELPVKPEISILRIETKDNVSITSKDEYIDAVLTIEAGEGLEQEVTTISTEIRGRGNSTWGMPKKPYRLKFDKKQSIFGSFPMKSWVLLANYSDKTLLRNHIGFELSRFLMAPNKFTPSTHFVELYLNGNYEGVYHLTDQIQVNEGRVNISELEGKEDEPITGGYLLEIDERLDETNWFRTKKFNLPITFKSPEEPNSKQFDYITNYIAEFESIIADKNISKRTEEYLSLIDVDSFVDFYLVNEIAKNNDAAGFSSIFLTKPENGLLQIGPVWDFDIAFGNVRWDNNDKPEGLWIKTSSRWYSNLFRDPFFRKIVIEKWNKTKVELKSHIFAEIDNNSDLLANSQVRNFEKWDILNQEVWPNPIVTGSYKGEVDYLKEWLNKRFNWLDEEINSWEN